jgi:hypothetical protein
MLDPDPYLEPECIPVPVPVPLRRKVAVPVPAPIHHVPITDMVPALV